MRHTLIILFALLLGLVLTACAGSSSTRPAGASPATLIDEAAGELNQIAVDGVTQQTASATRSDAQGAVTISVTPLNLDTAGSTLDFAVALETHSVDLSMDLATLATLATDNGRAAVPARWDAPLGGHHVAGTLSFPAETDDVPLLDGASRLTLTIRDVDAPQRTFVWEVSPPAN